MEIKEGDETIILVNITWLFIMFHLKQVKKYFNESFDNRSVFGHLDRLELVVQPFILMGGIFYDECFIVENISRR